MWARHAELALGAWLAVSPFVLRYDPALTRLWVHDFVLATVLVVTPLLSYWPPLRRIHLLLVPVALWLFGHGWWMDFTTEPIAAYQNWMVVGLLLALFAIVPSEAALPPEPWRAPPPARDGTGSE